TLRLKMRLQLYSIFCFTKSNQKTILTNVTNCTRLQGWSWTTLFFLDVKNSACIKPPRSATEGLALLP
ncbi:MAG TPA: hypothetical protein VHY08_12360, partial [Bacillota bacterium]|nr:hypothetical protein [Bacillota bacterium]